MVLSTSSSGDYFGEVGLLKSQPRAATITSLGGAVCCTTTAEGFEEMLRVGGTELRHKVETQVDKQMHRFISRIDLFKGLEDYYDDIAKVMTFRQYDKDETLCRHGEELDGFYNVVTGTARKIIEFVHTTEEVGAAANMVTRSDTGVGFQIPVVSRSNLPLDVGELEETSIFGVFTAISRKSTSEHTIVTKTPCVVLFIEKSNYQKLAVLAPPLQSKITAMLKQHNEAALGADVSEYGLPNGLQLRLASS